jgi:hypothetical protein
MATVKISYGDELRRFRLGTSGNRWADLQSNVRSLFNLPTDAQLTLKYTDSDGDFITVGSEIELAEAIADAAATSSVLRLVLSTTAMPSTQPTAAPMQTTSTADDKGKAPATVVDSAPSTPPTRRYIPVQVAGEQVSTPRDSAPSATADTQQETAPPPSSSATNDADPLQEMQQLFEGFMPRLLGELLGEQTTNSDSAAESEQPRQQGAEPKYAHWGVECDSCHSTVVGKRYKCKTCADFDLCEDCYQPEAAAQPGHDSTHVFAHVPHPLSFLPPSSAEFAERFGRILPGMAGMAGARCGRPRGCGAQWAGNHRPHHMYSRMGPAFFYM